MGLDRQEGQAHRQQDEEIVIEKGKVVKRPREQLNGYAAAYRKRQSVNKGEVAPEEKEASGGALHRMGGPAGRWGARSIRFLIRWSSDEEALIKARRTAWGSVLRTCYGVRPWARCSSERPLP